MTRHRLRTLPALALPLAALSLLLSSTAGAEGRRRIDEASPMNGPDGTPITADEMKEMDAVQKAVSRFEEAQKDYRVTVQHIVKQDYDSKRKELVHRYDSSIKAADKEARLRREDAIKLFEKFLEKYPRDARWTPDVIYRLAELYFERTSDEALADTSATATPADFTKTIGLFQRLITDFPNYRYIHGAYYLLGFCQDKMGKEAEARQAFLALVCSNHYKALDAPAPPAPSRGRGAAVAFVDPYQDCQPLTENRLIPEAWTRIGEYHFDYNELELAIASYAKVLKYKESSLFDKALYKLAWSYYRVDKYPDAIKRFDELVVYSDTQKAASGKEGSDLRSESVQYLGISFAEKDWNGDQIDDTESGLQRAETFYKGREAEQHVREIFAKLGDIYFDETEYLKAIEVYKRALQKWPYAPDNPKIQDKIILCLERIRNFDEALKESELFAQNYGKGSEWRKHNDDNKEAINDADERAEQRLAKSAVDHHNAARTLRKMALATTPPDAKKLEQALQEYGRASEAYHSYLLRYTNSKSTYEYTYNYADVLYYSLHFAEAAEQYEKVRDSNLDNKFLEDAAFAAVKSYEQVLDAEVKAGRLIYPPLPEVGKVSAPVQPIAIPDYVKKLEGAFDIYAQRVPNSPRLATMSYKSAETEFRYLHWDEARPRLEAILTKYCTDNVSIQAGKAILTSYTIENNLDKIVEWTDRLSKANCGTGKEAAEAKAATAVLKGDASFKICDRYFEGKDFENASKCYMDFVNGNPTNQGGNNDKALYNAALAFTKVNRYSATTKAYERIVKEYPQSQFVDEALFQTALSYEKFFEFDLAVASYQSLATDARFNGSKYRTDSLFNSARLLENNQNYDQAARLFQTYSNEKTIKKEDASEAFFRSGLIYLKSKDLEKAKKAFRDYIKNYTFDPKRLIEANYHIAEIFEQQKDKASALAQYKKVAAMGSAVPAASDAAEYAAHAAFILAEQQLPDLEKLKMSGNPKQFEESQKKFKAEVQRLTAEYNKVLDYKRATWTLAAYFRSGYVYELLSKALVGLSQTPCPKEVEALQKKQQRLGVTDPAELACGIYQQQLQDKIDRDVAGVDEEVVKRYRTTLEQAAKLGVSNEWTKLARQKANAYKPDEFPMSKDERVEFQMESP